MFRFDMDIQKCQIKYRKKLRNWLKFNLALRY